jgi:hypothetical protein
MMGEHMAFMAQPYDVQSVLRRIPVMMMALRLCRSAPFARAAHQVAAMDCGTNSPNRFIPLRVLGGHAFGAFPVTLAHDFGVLRGPCCRPGVMLLRMFVAPTPALSFFRLWITDIRLTHLCQETFFAPAGSAGLPTVPIALPVEVVQAQVSGTAGTNFRRFRRDKIHLHSVPPERCAKGPGVHSAAAPPQLSSLFYHKRAASTRVNVAFLSQEMLRARHASG